MSKFIFSILVAIMVGTDLAHSQSIFNLSATSIEGEVVELKKYEGKVLLVVNTASECGFTSQYKGLQELYETYRELGFEILGFPSNDFHGQEPGSNTEIKKFCELKYKVTFPMFAKGFVKGPDKQPVYRFLTEDSAPEFQGDPGWNFVKFLIGRDGKVIARFSSMTTPGSSSIKKEIEAALAVSPTIISKQ